MPGATTGGRTRGDLDVYPSWCLPKVRRAGLRADHVDERDAATKHAQLCLCHSSLQDHHDDGDEYRMSNAHNRDLPKLPTYRLPHMVPPRCPDCGAWMRYSRTKGHFDYENDWLCTNTAVEHGDNKNPQA